MGAEKKDVRTGRAPEGAESTVRYKQMTVEIFFTDREVKMGTFYRVKDVLSYIEEGVRSRYVDSVRIELF